MYGWLIKRRPAERFDSVECARALAIELELPLKATVDMFGAYRFHNGLERDLLPAAT